MEDEATKGARIIQDVASKAVLAAHKALCATLEAELPEDADPRNIHRQIGAAITACTMLYGYMLETTAQNPIDRDQAELAVDMMANNCAANLAKLTAAISRKGGQKNA